MKILTTFLFLVSVSSFAATEGEQTCAEGFKKYAENCCTCGDQILTNCALANQSTTIKGRDGQPTKVPGDDSSAVKQ